MDVWIDGKGVITLTNIQKKMMTNTSHEEQQIQQHFIFCKILLLHSYWLLFFFLDIPQKEIPFFKKICFFFLLYYHSQSKKVLHNKKNIHFVRSRSMPSARSEARFKVRRLNSTTKVNEKNFFTKRTAARGRVQFEQC